MSSILRIILFSLLFVGGGINYLFAQVQSLPLYNPSHEEILLRYQAVAEKENTTKNSVYKLGVNAHWLPGGNAFWYCNVLKDSATEYFLVDAVSGSKRNAFNEVELASALSAQGTQTVRPDHMFLQQLSFNKEATLFSFAYGGKYYQSNTKLHSLTTIDALPVPGSNHQFIDPQSRWDNYETDSLSPNKQYVAFIHD
ncbi:MAG TPA: hypothetical protein VNS32_26750, partial [Flavisolibacter sp.]|nr:hypothetical protein [Flavisolibacter sp.]